MTIRSLSCEHHGGVAFHGTPDNVHEHVCAKPSGHPVDSPTPHTCTCGLSWRECCDRATDYHSMPHMGCILR